MKSLLVLLIPLLVAGQDMSEVELEDGGNMQNGQKGPYRCFSCNSQVDPICNDDFHVDSPAILDNYLKECPEKDGVQPFCRKIKMHFDINGEERVERGCSYMKREGPLCYQRRSEDFVKDVCHCMESECNGAPAKLISVIAILVPFVALFL